MKSRYHTFTVFKKYKIQLNWIYWEKLFLRALAILSVFLSKIPLYYWFSFITVPQVNKYAKNI